jgi:hypothetical protein
MTGKRIGKKREFWCFYIDLVTWQCPDSIDLTTILYRCLIAKGEG